MTVSPRSVGSLLRLRDAGYEIAADDPDLRGWDVVLVTDERVGKVDELMVNPNDGRLRYLDGCVTPKAARRDHSRHLLIPILTPPGRCQVMALTKMGRTE